jgi:hypothetical protein
MDAGGNFFLYNTNFPLGARRLASGVRMRTLSLAARVESRLPILPHHRYSAMFLVSPSHLPEATLDEPRGGRLGAEIFRRGVHVGEPGRTNSIEKCPPYRFRAISLKDYGVVHPSDAEWQSRLCPRGVPIPYTLLLLFIHCLTSDSL